MTCGPPHQPTEEPSLAYLLEQHGDDEGADAEDGREEGRVWLVAQLEALGQ